LIFGNDCRKLGGVVKEGQGWWMTCFLTSQWKALWRHILQVKYCRCSHLVRRQRNAVINPCVTIAAKILLVYPKLYKSYKLIGQIDVLSCYIHLQVNITKPKFSKWQLAVLWKYW
jgi:hypothetical protein